MDDYALKIHECSWREDTYGLDALECSREELQQALWGCQTMDEERLCDVLLSFWSIFGLRGEALDSTIALIITCRYS